MKKAGLLTLFSLVILATTLSANRISNFAGTWSAGNAVLTWSHDSLTNVKWLRLYKRDIFSTNHTRVSDIPNWLFTFSDWMPDPNLFNYYRMVLVLSNDAEVNPTPDLEITGSTSSEKYDLIRFMENTASLSASGTISFYFGVTVRGMTQVSVLNVNREVVTILARGEMATGSYLTGWDGRNAAGQTVQPGIYIIAVNTMGGQAAKRVVLKP